MADKSGIEWTEATWNPIAGCSVVSPGCTNCYAMRRVAPRLAANPATPHYAGTVTASKGGPVWTGHIGIASDRVLMAPLRWTRPRMIFVNSTSDLFHPGVPDAVIDRVFAVMALCPQHTFQVLTKRPERMRAYLSDAAVDRRIHELACDMVVDRELQVVVTHDRELEPQAPPGKRIYLDLWPLPNVWLGTSVEDQRRADERIPHLLQTLAAVRFISAEPLLGQIDLTVLRPAPNGRLFGFEFLNALQGVWGRVPDNDDSDLLAGLSPTKRLRLDWVIAGGESGTGARPMHPDWARSLRDQCVAAGVPFFFKQWGNWLPFYDRDRDDPDWRDVPRVDNQMGFGAERHLNLAGGCGFHGERLVAVRNVGKHASGRLLDGLEHNGMPARAQA